MNIENFSTTSLPGLEDLGNKNRARGDDPGPKGAPGWPGEGCKGTTGIVSSNFINTYTSPNTITTPINPFHPYNWVSQIRTERLPMSEELYLYITGGKSCISTAPPTWNSQENCLWHAKGSRVLSIDGDYGLSCLIKPYIGSKLDMIYTYLTINEFNVYATILGPSGELFRSYPYAAKEPVKTKEDLIHRNRKK